MIDPPRETDRPNTTHDATSGSVGLAASGESAAIPASEPFGDVDTVDTFPRTERHFRTEHLMADITGRSVRGWAITMTTQFTKFAVQTGSTVVLARLLTPADFGLVAMATAVTGFVAMFKEAGLSMATVQRENITHDQVSTLFWINVGLSILLMILTASSAPAIAFFFGDQRLVLITLTISGTFIFGGLGIQHRALLRRQMRFRNLAIIDIIAMAAGVTIGVGTAWCTRSYWALVAIPCVTDIAGVVGAWLSCRWIPGRPTFHASVLPMLKFGGNFSGSSFFAYIAQSVDYVLLGWMWGATPVGLYRKSYELMMLPVRQLNTPLAGVMMPALSRLQNEPAAFRRMYLRGLQFLALAGMPLAGFLVMDAPEVTLLLLGNGWDGTSHLIRLMAPAASVAALYGAPNYIFVPLGQGRRMLSAAIMDAAIVATSVSIGAFWGAGGVAAAMSIGMVLSLSARTAYACQGSPVRFLDVLTAIQPVVMASLISASAIGLLRMARYHTSVAWIFADLAALFLLTFIALAASSNGRSLLTVAGGLTKMWQAQRDSG